jgi:Putative beta-barrel porin-2, OmpL-like. bbp2
MKSWLPVLAFCLPVFASFAQADSTGSIAFSGFVDVYYAYDFNKPENQERPGFLYNHKRHNEFNVNLALVKAAYAADRVRGNLALMAGTYPQYNLAAEQALLKNIYEANAGVKLAKGLWLDAGIFSSHIGMEGAISKDNLTLTRSLAAENSPYYESGVKLTYAAGSKWAFTGLVINGWQNIREPEGNSGKAIGTQVQFKPNDLLLLTSCSFFGNEKPDSTRQKRYFHDFYLTWQLLPAGKLAAVFDIGMERKLNKPGFNTWYSPALLAHYRLTNQLALAARMEYYSDKNGVIISTATPQGFKTSGYSLNLDYALNSNVLMRVEGRLLDSRDAIFTRSNKATDGSIAITSSLAVSF